MPLVKISLAKYTKTVVQGNLPNGINYAQLGKGGGNSLVHVFVAAAGSDSAVRIVDTANIAGDIAGGGYQFEQGLLISTLKNDSKEFAPPEARPMKKGIAVVFEQGTGAEVNLLYD